MDYIIEMCGITKEFPGIIANDDVTLQLKKGRDPCAFWAKTVRENPR